jgi:putative heme-binding domain-containing protein
MRHSILLAGLLLAACAWAQERSERNAYTSPADVAAGARLYRPLCSNCHGQQGQGWPGFTPNLAGELHHVKTDGDIYDLLHTGLPGTDMPAFTLDERETWQIVAFVRSFANDLGRVAGDAEAGAKLFRDRGCINCHRVGDEGGRLGPDLRAAAAVTSPDGLKEAITDPNRSVHPRTFRVRATTEDGQVVEGVRLNEDSFSLQALTAAGSLVSLDKTKLRSFEVLPDSSMPSYGGRLSDKELDDVVAYLARLAAGAEK